MHIGFAANTRFNEGLPRLYPLATLNLTPSMHCAVALPIFFTLSGGWHEVVPDQVRRHPLELMASAEIEWRERSLARKNPGASC